MKNKIKKVITLLVIIIILLNMINIYSSRKSLFGLRTFIVASNSMIPVLIKDDMIIILKQDKYEVGDIVTKIENNMYITHKIVEINDDYVITKGEDNDVNDSKSDVNNIIGKLIIHIPSWLLWITRIVSVIIIVMLLFI